MATIEVMTRCLLLAGLLLGCWGSSDEKQHPEAVAGAPAQVTQATECASLDEVGACYSCNGELVPGTLIELDGSKLWNPSGDSSWRLLDVDGDQRRFCRE